MSGARSAAGTPSAPARCRATVGRPERATGRERSVPQSPDRGAAGVRADDECTGPGRVNLIGDHTDYNQGLALPDGHRPRGHRHLRARAQRPTWWSPRTPTPESGPRAAPLDPGVADRPLLEPAWARLVAAVVSAGPTRSRAAGSTSRPPSPTVRASRRARPLAVALADALRGRGTAAVVARLCQEAEHRIGRPGRR